MLVGIDPEKFWWDLPIGAVIDMIDGYWRRRREDFKMEAQVMDGAVKQMASVVAPKNPKRIKFLDLKKLHPDLFDEKAKVKRNNIELQKKMEAEATPEEKEFIKRQRWLQFLGISNEELEKQRQILRDKKKQGGG